jgi:asparagine synthase (glutamine-hydrolysing)
MPGICGWLDESGQSIDARQTLSNMAAGLARLSGETQHSVDFAGAALQAVAREADLHFYQDDQLVIALEGQPHWSDPDLAALAHSKGHGSAIADAFRKHDSALLEKLHGPFALAVLDVRAGDIMLAVDRMGIHRICYAPLSGQGVVFGSTTESVRAYPPVGATLDPRQIFLYLFFHAVPSPGTIYTEQQKLLPGQFLRCRNGALQTGFYWQPQFTDDASADFAQLHSELHAQLTAAVRRCAAGDGEVGAFLSGGVDSSAVSGVLSTLREQPIPTYSIGFPAAGYDEMEYARITSRHFRTKAHEYYVTPHDVTDVVPKIAAAYDEPFGNASAVPTYYCARLAKEAGTECMLAGDGGDELFGGNARYAHQKIFEAYHHIPNGLRSSVIEPLIFGFPLGGLWPIRKARSYIEQAKIPLPERLETYNFLNRVDLNEMFEPQFLAAIDPQLPEHLMREEYLRTNSTSAINRMLHLEWKQVLADNDLRKVVHMCTLADMPVRFPLLEDELVSFSTRLPADYKVKNLKLRYFFKKAMRDFLPTEVLTKSKHGFGLPFGVWLRTEPELQQLAGDSLTNLKNRNYIRPDFIDNLIQQHRTAHSAFYGETIWVLMMLELWLQSHGF